MFTGSISVIVYETFLSPIGGFFELYSLLPCFILAGFTIIIVSLCTKEPNESVSEDFEKMLKLI